MPIVPDLLDEPHATSLRQRIDDKTNACSLFNIYLGFKSGLEEYGVKHYSNSIKGDDVKALKDIHPNNTGDWSKRSFVFVDYNKIDSQLAPAGKSVGVICCADYLKDWDELNKEDYNAKKEEVAQILLGRLDKQFPGIRESIDYYEVATPKTIERYTSNTAGSVYGFAQTKEQSGLNRLRNNFLIPNLYFASAWAFPGGGFEGSIMAGFLAALQMNRDKIWSTCDDEKYVDQRIVKLLERKEIDKKTLELNFEKPANIHHQKGQYASLNLLEPKVTELDLPYRWLPIASSPEEAILRFNIPQDKSSFQKSCELLKVGDKAMVIGPVV
jgi:hypothetical protein